MLILSKDKRRIVNFENSDCIAECSGFVKAFNGPEYTNLGEYKTEERCKEIINDICEQYTRFLNFPGAEGNAVFQMPEE